MDKIKHALGMDKSGSGGAQGMGDNRIDGHNTYDAGKHATGSGASSTANPAMDPNSRIGQQAGLNNAIYNDEYGQGDHSTRSSHNSGLTNAATTGTGAGYQEHHAQHDKQHSHHTGSGAAAGALAGHHEGHTASGALGGAAVGHEMGERGQHGQHGTHGHQEGQQKEGMMHKIERKMGMDPEQREVGSEERGMNSGMMGSNLQHTGGIASNPTGTNTTGTHSTHHTGSGMTGTHGTHGSHHTGTTGQGMTGSGMTGQSGHNNVVPVSNIQERAGGFTGTPDGHGNVY